MGCEHDGVSAGKLIVVLFPISYSQPLLLLFYLLLPNISMLAISSSDDIPAILSLPSSLKSLQVGPSIRVASGVISQLA